MTFADSILAQAITISALPDSMVSPGDSTITGILGAGIVHTLPLLMVGLGLTLLVMGCGLILMLKDRTELPAFPKFHWRLKDEPRDRDR